MYLFVGVVAAMLALVFSALGISEILDLGSFTSSDPLDEREPNPLKHPPTNPSAE